MSDAVIDPSVLKNLLEATGGDEAFLIELLDVYFENSAKLLGLLHEGVAESRAEKLRHAAHDLKSNSASLGAHTLAALCRELEEQSRAGNLADAAERLAQIEIEYERVQRALQAAHPTK